MSQPLTIINYKESPTFDNHNNGLISMIKRAVLLSPVDGARGYNKDTTFPAKKKVVLDKNTPIPGKMQR